MCEPETEMVLSSFLMSKIHTHKVFSWKRNLQVQNINLKSYLIFKYLKGRSFGLFSASQAPNTQEFLVWSCKICHQPDKPKQLSNLCIVDVQETYSTFL